MAEGLQPKFEHSALDRDIARLSREVKERQESGEAEHPEKAVRDILRERMYPSQQQGQVSQAQPQQPGEPLSVLPVYLQKESPEVRLKVEELADMALHQGLNKAIDEARQYGPFVLDALHDTLTGKLYDELKNRGLI